MPQKSFSILYFLYKKVNLRKMAFNFIPPTRIINTFCLKEKGHIKE